MFFVTAINIDREHALFAYCAQMCMLYKNLRNVANFYIRNTMTGIRKEPADRYPAETDVLENVEKGIAEANLLRQAAAGKKAAKSGAVAAADLFRVPDAKKWFLSYPLLDAILKCTQNTDYYALPAQVNQQALKDTVRAWKSYFSLQRKWKTGGTDLTGAPRIPSYIREPEATATFTNQVCKILPDTHAIRFPKTNAVLKLGDMPIRGRLIRVHLQPWHGIYRALVTFWDGQGSVREEPDQDKEDLEGIPDLTGQRLMGVDLGVGNFVAAVDNTGGKPILIKGGFLKAENQLYNKRLAHLVSELTKGRENQKHHPTKALTSLSRKRDDLFRDAFYKMAHALVDEAVKREITAIIVGRNKGWKQETDMGTHRNQEFVQIPHARFLWILRTVASHAGIPVYTQEESYTSKASLLDGDEIPTYKKGDTREYTFSGKRVQRGLYQSSSGQMVNADLNGAGNILRKAVPDAFAGMELTFLTEKIQVLTPKGLYPVRRCYRKRRKTRSKAQLRSFRKKREGQVLAKESHLRYEEKQRKRRLQYVPAA